MLRQEMICVTIKSIPFGGHLLLLCVLSEKDISHLLNYQHFPQLSRVHWWPVSIASRGSPHLCSLYLCLYFSFANKFICMVFLSFFKHFLFICLLAVLGLCSCVETFSSCSELGLLSGCRARFSLQWLLLLQSEGSRAPRLQAVALRLSSVAHGLSCSAACGILPDQGSTPRSLPCQADS